MIGIYMIKSKVNNKVYIGCSNNIERRFKEHKKKLVKNIHHNKHLQNHYNKYNKIDLEVYNYTTVENCTSIKELQKLEMHYIKYFNSENKEQGFNLTAGGEDLCNMSSESKIAKRESIVAKLKPIFCYSIDGKFISQYKCVPDAALNLKLNKNSIMNALHRGIQIKGYLFYKIEKIFSKYEPNFHGSKISVFDKSGNFIEELRWMKQASEKYNIKMNTINTSCNRLSLCKSKYYFVKSKNKQTLLDKLSAFGEDKVALRLLDNELGG